MHSAVPFVLDLCAAAEAVRRFLTVADIADALQVSTETVIREFSGREGVIDVGTSETMHKRGKRLLRIPEHVFERFVTEKQVKARRK